jgi:phosphonate degradation associated HDIG domain protein
MLATVQSIIDLYAAKGGARYGSELVSQLEHALQCAQLAQEEGAGTELVAAAFLHDVGHLVVERPNFMGREIDDLHQFVGLPLLRGLFGGAVLEPIRLHVEAKRYLCQAEAGYWDRLSPASRHSLELQGGPFSGVEAGRFLGRLHAREAISLRRWDDRARLPGQNLPDLDFVSAVLEKAADCHKTAMAGA